MPFGNGFVPRGDRTRTDPAARVRRFSLTIQRADVNAVAATLREQRDAGNVEYAVCASEHGTANETPHVQAYVVLTGRVRFNAAMAYLRSLFPGCHVEACFADDEANIRYIEKELYQDHPDGDFGDDVGDEDHPGRIHYIGQAPAPPAQAARAHNAAAHDRYQEACDLAMQGRMDEIPAALRLRHYKAFKEMRNDIKVDTRPLEHQGGLWIYGPKGTGKTTAAFEAFPPEMVYIKDKTKWWIGYAGEPVILLDELQPRHCMPNGVDSLVTMLKDVGGHLPFRIETKGGGMMIRPPLIIVTANFAPQDVFKSVDVDLEPILKRFKLKHAPGRVVDPATGSWTPSYLTSDEVLAAVERLPPVRPRKLPTRPVPACILSRFNPLPGPGTPAPPSITGTGAGQTATWPGPHPVILVEESEGAAGEEHGVDGGEQELDGRALYEVMKHGARIAMEEERARKQIEAEAEQKMLDAMLRFANKLGWQKRTRE